MTTKQLAIIDAAIEVATFSKTNVYPHEGTPLFFDLANKLDRLATAINAEYPNFNRGVRTASQSPTEEKAKLAGAPPHIAYQPQYLWVGCDWLNIGPPVASKNVARNQLAAYLTTHPGETVRMLKVLSSSEEIDVAEFLPSQSPTDRFENI